MDLKFVPRWGPFLIVLASLFLCMADLTRHLVNDAWGTACESLDRDASPDAIIGFRSGPGADWNALPAKFTKYCYPRNVANEYTDSGALSVWGWTFSVGCTWTGFILLFVGIFWAVSLPQKLLAQWRSLRRPSRQNGAREPLSQA